MGKRIVIALGGNALGKNLPEQMAAVKHTARAIVDLIEEGHQVVVAHGNGPQVGMINTAMTTLSREDPTHPMAPMSVCTAMSQGYIGYDLQNSLREELLDRGIHKAVTTILTQVEVDPEDPAFQNPTKPIGTFMTEAEAEEMRRRGNAVMEDAGRGWRLSTRQRATTSRVPVPSSTRTSPRNFWRRSWMRTLSSSSPLWKRLPSISASPISSGWTI